MCDHQVEEDRFDGYLLLTAYDTAYSRYLEEALSKSVRLQDAAAGITGAIDVFAAADSAALPVVLQ